MTEEERQKFYLKHSFFSAVEFMLKKEKEGKIASISECESAFLSWYQNHYKGWESKQETV